MLKFCEPVTKFPPERIFTYETIRKQKPQNTMSTPRNYTIAKWLMGVTACAILGFGLMSFQDSARNKKNDQPYAQVNDTVPEKHISPELNNAIKELGEALSQVGKEISKINWDQVNKEVEISLKEVNIEKIMTEVRHAIEKADVSKITRELNDEMKKVDHEKLRMDIQKEVEESLKGLKDIDWKEMESQLKDVEIKVKDFDKEKLKAELEKIKPVIKEKMEELKEEMKKIEKEQKKANKSGYACNKTCPQRLKAALDDMEFTPEIPVEPMI